MKLGFLSSHSSRCLFRHGVSCSNNAECSAGWECIRGECALPGRYFRAPLSSIAALDMSATMAPASWPVDECMSGAECRDGSASDTFGRAGPCGGDHSLAIAAVSETGVDEADGPVEKR